MNEDATTDQPESNDSAPPTAQHDGGSAGSGSANASGVYRIRFVQAVILAVFTLVNLVAMPLLATGEAEGLLIVLESGTLITELAILACWFVFAPLGLLSRTVRGIATGTLWFAAYAVGGTCVVLASDDAIGKGFYFYALVVYATALPCVILAAQAPLWCVRFWFGWRLEKVDPSGEIAVRNEAGRPQFQIRDLMIATAAIAVALGIAKVGDFGFFSSSTEHFLVLSIIAGVVAAISAMSVLTCLAAALRPKSTSWNVLTAGMTHVVVVCVFLVVAATLGGELPTTEGWALYLFVFGIHFSLFMVVLRAVRKSGFRLFWQDE